ncbi:MFS transporter [Vibrio palustris]|uniref:Major Facilitator Superfamily protein n=1 Tax=Vibrio palustris TaxID=1918946 RepID=A0A1R4B3G9_9VIBR|nr:MFS transporter [Vibrio palustris]SJL83459.1 hypothetical protein VPAL9027_01427 [Vibrio palustris]
MKLNNKTKLFLFVMINSIGNWLTFTALSLKLLEEYGVEHVTIGLLIQSIPSVLLSKYVGRVSDQFSIKNLVIYSQVLLSLSILGIVLNDNIYMIYIMMIVSSVIRVFYTPVFNSLIGEFTATLASRTQFYTQLSAAGSFAIMASPALGAYISLEMGLNFLLIIDFFSYYVSLFFILDILRQQFNKKTATKSSSNLAFNFLHSPEKIKAIMIVWFLFLFSGAALNAVEFPALSFNGFEREQIGYIVAAWGVGGFMSLFLGNKINSVSSYLMSVVLILVYFVIIYSDNFNVVFFMFVIGGLSMTIISGITKSKIQNNIDAEDVLSISVWTYINKGTGLINVVIYVFFSISFFWFNECVSYLSFLGFSLIYVISYLIYSKYDVTVHQHRIDS